MAPASGFSRTISLPADTEIHSGPRNPGDPVQTFPNEMYAIDREIFGDPDFDLLRVQAGTSFGLPSPGQTTLTQQPGGDFAVDSFFDITYRIDFTGAPGSMLDGLSGSTTGTLRMTTGDAPVLPGPKGPWPMLVAVMLAISSVALILRWRAAAA